MAFIRIDKYLSLSLGISRGDAKLLLKSGKISVRMLDRPSSPVVLLHLSTMRNKHTKHIT